MKNEMLLSIYLFLRYVPLMIIGYGLAVVFGVIDTHILINFAYFLSVNYLAVKYAIIYGLNKNDFITKKDVRLILSVLLFIFNIIIYLMNDRFQSITAFIFSIIPIIMLVIIKTDKEKQFILDNNNQKVIDDYFNHKK